MKRTIFHITQGFWPLIYSNKRYKRKIWSFKIHASTLYYSNKNSKIIFLIVMIVMYDYEVTYHPITICKHHQENWRPDYYNSFAELEWELNFSEFLILRIMILVTNKVVSLLLVSVRPSTLIIRSTREKVISIRIIWPRYLCLSHVTHKQSPSYSSKTNVTG